MTRNGDITIIPGHHQNFEFVKKVMYILVLGVVSTPLVLGVVSTPRSRHHCCHLQGGGSTLILNLLRKLCTF